MEYEVEITVRRHFIDSLHEVNEVQVYNHKFDLTTTKSWYSKFNKEATAAFDATEADEIKLQDECVHTITVDNRCDDCGMYFEEQEAFDKDR
jgi:copper oxidase (laccase) domain-containing protein